MKAWIGWIGGMLAGLTVHGAGADWNVEGGHAWRALAGVPLRAPGFSRMNAPAVGITFTNALSDERSIGNRNLLSGAGVACGDVDGDGWTDLYFCGLDSDNRLFRNLGGWKFEDITSGEIACAGADATGAAFADVDGDGDLDLLVNLLGGGTRLFRNDGRGRFADVTVEAGLKSSSGATSLALADLDGDGDLDLYVANFRPTTILDRPTARFSMQTVAGRPEVISVDGRPVTEPDLKDRFRVGVDGQVEEYGEPDVLWLNDGTGRFTAVSWTGGVFVEADGRRLAEPPRDWGLAARFHDVDRDGDPDLYVCNDLWTPDRFWINESRPGELRFRAVDTLALRSNPTFSMGVDFGDLNADGEDDLYAVDMLGRSRRHRQTQLAAMAPEFRPPGAFEDRAQMRRNVLQWRRPDGTYSEAAYQGGVEASDWSWGPVFVDTDLDGFEDILVATGQHRDFQDSDGAERIAAAQRGGRGLTPAKIQELVRTLPRLITPKVLFRNQGDGTFVESARELGIGDEGIAQGMALADLDNDGDADVVANHLFEAPALYRNEGGAGRVAVELRGPKGNPFGIGARVTVRATGLPAQVRQMIAGGRYLSGDQPRRCLATGTNAAVAIEVAWPDGRTSVVSNAVPGRLYRVDHAAGQPGQTPPSPRGRIFEDVTSRLGHVHVDEPYDDFERQPLLPHRLSQLGPGVTWTDLDGDGADDLVVGTGKGGMPAAYLSKGGGTFSRADRAPFNRVAGRDLTTFLPVAGALLAGSANYEDGLTNGGCIRILDVARGGGGEAVLGPPFSVGPMAAADLDGDGALEVFVGGRVIPGRYPEAATSFVLRTAGGRLAVVQRLEGLGLVSGACFSDLDGDGDADLVVAREWGTLGFLRNEGGRLEPWSPAVHAGGRRLEEREWAGFWNGVTAGDFDGDGRMDLVASNWGRNTAYRATGSRPYRLFHGQAGGPGPDLIEAWSDETSDRSWPVRELPVLRMTAPHLVERFTTHAAFAEASVGDLVSGGVGAMRRVEVCWLDSSVLLNRGDRFELVALPAAAQRAPAFGICVADCDGDGREDVFLAQNWSAGHPMMQRNDGGRGLWLRGDGRGGFVADEATGVAVYGDGRGAAVADFDADGRVDLAVAQNGAATTLWRNVGARPGLRVRLGAGAADPGIVGARIRLVYGERRGPAREIHLGAGYWSVDSPVPVLGLDGKPSAVEVTWGRGKVSLVPVPAGAGEVQVSR